MKQILAAIVFGLMLSTGAFAQSTWAVDNIHSHVKFSVSHLVISEVEGNFGVYDGTLESSEDFSDAKVQFSVDVKSISTGNEGRDKHLKGDDFFSAEKFPKAIFKSTSWKKIGDNNFELGGNLTIRDVTKPVKFNVVYGGTMKDPYGNVKAGFKALAVINRFDFGLRMNALTETGGAVIGQDVTLTLKLEMAQKKSL